AKSYITDSDEKFFKKHEYIEYKNKKIRVPYQFKDYLKVLYGDWKVVRKNLSFDDLKNFKDNALTNKLTVIYLNSLENIGNVIINNLAFKQNILLIGNCFFLEENIFCNEISQGLKQFNVYKKSLNISNPDIEDIYKLKKELDDKEFDLILAIGGGSIIDTAKAISCFNGYEFKKEEQLRENIIEKKYIENKNYLPIVAIPTTAGTGSEVTRWATIWDKKNLKKYSIEAEFLYPALAVMAPKLTLTMPEKLTATTALDALSHAVEAYWAKKSNPVVRDNAIKAIKAITVYLPELLDDLSNLSLREKILETSLNAGLAFSQTKTTACHSISYPLSMKYNIAHGVATSMTLFELFKINKDKMLELDNFIKAFNAKEDKHIDNFIKFIFNKVDISYKLKDYGVKFEELETLADECFTPERMNNNPVEISKEMVLKVLKNIY
ncbi:MAG: phosphonoacetaldehyde reductase, partial [Candidatus Muiribacteriota bacterium]